MPLAVEKENIRTLLHDQLDQLIPELYPAAIRSATGWRVGSADGEPGSSLSITTTGPDAGKWNDFAAESKGDVFALIQQRHGLSFPDALNWARDYLGMPRAASRGRASTTSNGSAHKATSAKPEEEPAADPRHLTEFIDQAQAALERGESKEAQRALAYLTERRLTSRRHFGVIDASVTAAAFDAGYRKSLHGRLLIVYQDATGRPVYFNARDLTGKAGEAYKYMKPKGMSMPLPFNAAALDKAEARGQLILTEGELDAASILTAYGAHHPVIGCSGGTLPAGWHERIAAAGCAVFILADDDGPGRKKAEELQARLSGLDGAGSIRIASLPGHKDANAALQALGPAGLVEAVESALTASKAARISDYLYITDTWLAEIDARAARAYSHYSTGLPELDSLLGGGYLEGLHLIGGITGGGKTSLALSIAIHNALEGRAVLYGSYEQSRLELWARIASRITGVPQRAIKTGKYDDRGREVRTSDVLRASAGWEQLQQLSLFLKVVEGGDALSRQAGVWSVETLASAAREAAAAHGAPPLVIIDYLQRMPVPADMRIRDVRERVGAVAGMLQTMLGRELSAPIIALSSVGRQSYNAEAFARAALEERLTAFKEAGELEYTSYTALLLYGLPESKQGTQMLPGPMSTFRPRVLDLVKNREGTTGRLAVKWAPQQDTWTGAIKYGSDSEAL